MRGEPLPPDRQLAYRLGLCYREMNTILGRIRRRASGEPTDYERTRLAHLKDKVKTLKAGEGEWGKSGRSAVPAAGAVNPGTHADAAQQDPQSDDDAGPAEDVQP
jgi:hypothetical protein